MTGFPWTSGDELDASDLNDAVSSRAPAIALTTANSALVAANAAIDAANAAKTVANNALPLSGGTMTGNFDAPVKPPSMLARNLTTKFGDSATIKDFGAKGDGATDDTAAIQAAFTWATTTGNPINPTSGMFLVSSPLVLLPNLVVDGIFKRPGPEINLGQRAYFKATAAMNAMLTVGSTASDFSGLVVEWTLKLGEWDCNDLASEGIAVAFANGCRIRDTRVRNHKTYGFHLGSQASPTPSFQIYIEDCGTDRALTDPVPTGSVGVFYDNATDSSVMNSVIIGNRIGISGNVSGGAASGIWDAKIINVHVWNYEPSGELLYGIDVWGDNHIIGCQVDGPFQYAYRFRQAGNVITNSECNYGGPGSLAGHAYPILIDTGAGVTAIGNRWKCTNPATKMVSEAAGPLDKFVAIENIIDNTVSFGARGFTSVNTWAYLQGGVSPQITRSINVGSVQRNAQGDYTMSTNNRLDLSSAIIVTPSGGAAPLVAVEDSANRTEFTVRVKFYNLSGALTDPAFFGMIVLGSLTSAW